MTTITLVSPGQFRLTNSERHPVAPAGEALARVRRVGICGTDMHAFRGRQPFFTYPRVLGHELAVELLEVGPNEHALAPGDRCAVEPYLNCGGCAACKAGRTNCCESLRVFGVHVDGGMRDVISVPVSKLHRSSTLSLDQLALVETLGIGAHAVDRATLQPGEQALVIGAGPIGLSVVQFALLAGARVSVADLNPRRLQACTDRFDVQVVKAGGEDAASVRKVCGGELPSAVFDATGSAASMQNAFGFVGPGGRLVLVGLVLADITFNDPEFHRREMTLLATRNSTGADFKRLIQLMESGHIDAAEWITHRAAAPDMIQSFPNWMEPESGCIKAMVEF